MSLWFLAAQKTATTLPQKGHDARHIWSTQKLGATTLHNRAPLDTEKLMFAVQNRKVARQEGRREKREWREKAEKAKESRNQSQCWRNQTNPSIIPIRPWFKSFQAQDPENHTSSRKSHDLSKAMWFNMMKPCCTKWLSHPAKNLSNIQQGPNRFDSRENLKGPRHSATGTKAKLLKCFWLWLLAQCSGKAREKEQVAEVVPKLPPQKKYTGKRPQTDPNGSKR